MTDLVQTLVRPGRSAAATSIHAVTHGSPDSRSIARAAASVAAVIASASAAAIVGRYDQSTTVPDKRLGRAIDEQLFDSLAFCKITASQFSMLFDPSWQGRFFAQLDRLMDKDEWEADDVPVTTGSFRTLMRLLLKLRDKKRPGLGLANQGHVVATWSAGAQDRLTIECLPDDRLWWIVSYTLDAGAESAAGNTSLDRIIEVLQPYDPGHWLNEGAEHPA